MTYIQHETLFHAKQESLSRLFWLLDKRMAGLWLYIVLILYKVKRCWWLL